MRLGAPIARDLTVLCALVLGCTGGDTISTDGGSIDVGGTDVSVGGSGGTAGSVSGAGGTAGQGAGSGGTAGIATGSGGAAGKPGSGGTAGVVTGSGGVAGKPTGSGGAVTGKYQMEDLDRGVVAVKVSNGVYVGWRMMGYEYDATNPGNVSYNVYRDGTKVASVTDSTNYVDAAGTTSSKYTVTVVIGGVEGAQSPAASVWAQQYLTIPLQQPAAGALGGTYSPNDASTGDLDGDGKLDIVLKWDPSNSLDAASAGQTDPCIIDGIKLDGTLLWRINIGKNIRSGAHDTQFSVYDFDGDGKAEVAFKTAPGTKDGKGNYLHTGPAAGADHTKDYRGSRGMALGGPEWLTVFAGPTGEELATVEYPVLYGSSTWGDTNGNRSHRFNGGVSFVSDTGTGKTATGRPSIIQQRGYYTRLTVSAYNWRDGALKKVWTYDSGTSGGAFGQGNHSCMTGDVDGDGAFEIIPGASTINSDGTFRCKTGLGHGDALHVGRLILGKELYVFMPHESDGGHDCHSASTCATIFKTTSTSDNGRGVAEWVSTASASSASCSSSRGGNVYCGDGSSGATSAGSNFLMYWDADEARELMSDITISKAGGGTLLTASGCASNNSTKATPTLTADLLGDWREELVLRTTDNKSLRVYTTTAVTKRRIYTLMHDPTYRMQVSFEQSSYNQPPHVGFHIGPGMAAPPKPDIHVK